MRRNILREKLNNNESTISTHIHSVWPSVVEAIGHAHIYDYVEFVAEYGRSDLHDLDNLARAADIYDLGIKLFYYNLIFFCIMSFFFFTSLMTHLR